MTFVCTIVTEATRVCVVARLPLLSSRRARDETTSRTVDKPLPLLPEYFESETCNTGKGRPGKRDTSE